MFSVYVVNVDPITKQKNRFHIHTYDSEKEAVIIATNYAYDYSYAYVKEIGTGVTLHYIPHREICEPIPKEHLSFAQRRKIQLKLEKYYADCKVLYGQRPGLPGNDDVPL